MATSKSDKVMYGAIGFGVVALVAIVTLLLTYNPEPITYKKSIVAGDGGQIPNDVDIMDAIRACETHVRTQNSFDIIYAHVDRRSSAFDAEKNSFVVYFEGRHLERLVPQDPPIIPPPVRKKLDVWFVCETTLAAKVDGFKIMPQGYRFK